MKNYSDELKEGYLKAVDRISDLIQNRDESDPGTFFVKVNNRLDDSRYRVEILFWLANTLCPDDLKILVYREEYETKADLVIAPQGFVDSLSLHGARINGLRCLELLGTTDFIYTPENDRDCRSVLLSTFLEIPFFTINKIKEDFIKRIRDIEIVQV